MPDDDAQASTEGAVQALARAAGVELSYHDVYGRQHTARTDALVALLGALGFPARTPGDAERSLKRLEADRWERRVPPVTVLRRHGRFAIPLALPASALTTPHRWRIVLEDGSVVSGTSGSGDLSVLETAVRDGTSMARAALALPEDLPDGYHSFFLGPFDDHDLPGSDRRGTLIVAPAACWLPEAFHQGERAWGINCQLSTLRSRTNWGMGDFADLSLLANSTARAGGDVVGINPLHALFHSRPRDASPYSPSSRMFLNPLYISIEEVPEYPHCSEAQAILADPAIRRRLHKAQKADWVDYKAVATLKHDILDPLFQQFERAGTVGRRKAFEAFVKESGERLHHFAVFQVLEAHHKPKPWRQWPEEHRRCDTPAVAAFAREHEHEVRFHMWLQFEAERQFEQAAGAMRAGGGRIGIYRDLAVGVNSDGADTWMDPDIYAIEARFGAPPDDLGPLGQDWGLPPMNPHALRRHAYAPFAAMLQANMRHAGALRIDHAMALQHLFWIPPGMAAADGIYVSYPMDDLMGVLALESHRNRCLVIGEDLGTVPEGFRDRMAEENILSYRLLYFERWESGLFKRPEVYPALAVATATSHDMAPIAGNWEGWDIALRHRLKLARDGTAEDEEQKARAADRETLVAALQDQNLLPADFSAESPLDEGRLRQLIRACHQFLARSPARLMLVNLDDLVGENTQVNVPGTTDQYPNWSRRLKISLEDILKADYFRDATADIARERGHRS